MKNKFLYYALAFFIFSVCSCSCDKEGGDPEPLPVIDAPQALKDYIVFKPGTYWIYKDSTSGVVDSVFVTDFIEGHDTLYPSHAASGIYEWFQVNTHSALDGYDYYYKFNADDIYHIANTLYAVNREKLKPGDYVGTIYCFISPFTIGLTAYTVYDVTTVSNYYSGITIGSHLFPEVVKIHETRNVTEEQQVTNFYFSKNIGIVRKELVDSSKVWNIERYFIVY